MKHLLVVLTFFSYLVTFSVNAQKDEHKHSEKQKKKPPTLIMMNTRKMAISMMNLRRQVNMRSLMNTESRRNTVNMTSMKKVLR